MKLPRVYSPKFPNVCVACGIDNPNESIRIGAASRLMAAMLFQTSTADPVVFAAVPLLLIAVGAVATYAPARRAVRVDPLIALRQQ